MSRKRDRKILKYLKRRSTPKRIAGVKIPKALRRAADTELGAALIAQVILGSAGAARTSPAARKLRRRTQRVASEITAALGDSVQEIAAAVGETVGKSRRPGRADGETKVPLPH